MAERPAKGLCISLELFTILGERYWDHSDRSGSTSQWPWTYRNGFFAC